VTVRSFPREWLNAARVAALAAVVIAVAAWAYANGVQKRSPEAGRRSRTPVFVGYGGRSIVLTGVWSLRTGWRGTDDPSFGAHLPRSAKWSLYHIGRVPVVTAGGAPHTAQERSGQRYYCVDLAASADALAHAPGEPADWLAVSGPATADRRQVTVLPTTQDSLVEEVRRRLGSPGLWQSPHSRVVQNIALDLNGDGRQDRLVTVNNGLFGDSNFIVAAWRPGKRALRLSVLARTVTSREERPDDDRVLAARVFAVGDVNGDGLAEVAVSWGIPDGNGMDLYQFEPRGFRRVIHAVFVGA